MTRYDRPCSVGTASGRARPCTSKPGLNRAIRVLLLAPPFDADSILRALDRAGFRTTHWRVESEAEYIQALHPAIDVIFAADDRPPFTALQALEHVKQRGLEIPVIIMSGAFDAELATAYISDGASDCIRRDHVEGVGPAVARALEGSRVQRQHRRAQEELWSLQAQLRQSQKSEAIGRLAGGLVHDMNNLLTAILGHAELILADWPADHAHWENLDEIRRAGESAAALTRQLLTFIRQQTVQLTTLSVNEVIAETEKLVRCVTGAKVSLSITLDPVPVLVQADRTQLEQVLLNLVVNARDAMPAGGSIHIETATVEFRAGDARPPRLGPGVHAVLRVIDTGCGMSEAVRSRAFEPFFTTKDAGKGTGLGLAIVARVIEQAAGDIEISSVVGQGTTVSVYLPRASPGGA